MKRVIVQRLQFCIAIALLGMSARVAAQFTPLNPGAWIAYPVGIGTQPPLNLGAELLHIYGTSTNFLPTVRMTTTAFNGEFPCTGIGELALETSTGMYSSLSDIGDVVLRSFDMLGQAGFCADDIILSAYTDEGDIRFATFDADQMVDTEKMTILNSGFVGIGNNTPTRKLSVVGLGNETAVVGEFMRDEYALVDIVGGFDGHGTGGNAVLRHYNTLSSGEIGDYWMLGLDGEDDGKFKIARSLTSKFSDSRTKFVIQKDGNVAIGAVSSHHKLDVRAKSGESPVVVQIARDDNTLADIFSDGSGPGRNNAILRFWNNQGGHWMAGLDGEDGNAFKIAKALDYHFRQDDPQATDALTKFTIRSDGEVRIGNRFYNGSDALEPVKLSVDGAVVARECVITISDWKKWADYVFEPDYVLRDLDELEASIRREKRLPGVPSAEEVVRNGVNVAAMQATLLEKVEELTLYVIELHKENKELRRSIGEMQQKSGISGRDAQE